MKRSQQWENNMPPVQTVLGPIDSSALGVTLMHEHLVFASTGFDLDSASSVDWQAAADFVVDRLFEAKAAGVNTVVDATAIGMGRSAEFLAAVSQRSGINVIASTGVWARGIPLHFNEMDAERLAEVYVVETSRGIQGSGIRAGLIKAASAGHVVEKAGRRNLVAAAIAARETGLPVITHTDEGTSGEQQLDILVGCGVRPSKVVIGHSCCNGDLSYHRVLFRVGAFVGFDRIGMEGEGMQSDEVRLRSVAAHVAAGFAPRIMLSTDSILHWLGRRPAINPAAVEREHMHLFRSFIPRLKRHGVSDADIRRILVDNPRRLFET